MAEDQKEGQPGWRPESRGQMREGAGAMSTRPSQDTGVSGRMVQQSWLWGRK